MKPGAIKISSIAAPVLGRKLFGLQMLRAIAALMVVYSHLMERIVLRGFLDNSAWWFNHDLGRFGVCIFFAISGFVMIHAHWNEFGKSHFRNNSVHFLKKRVARIYPMYVLCTTILIPFAYLTKHETVYAVDVVKSLLFIPYKNEAGFFEPVYGLGWSLDYEMFFYLILAAALYFSLRNAVLAICGFISCLILVGIVLGGDPAVHYHSDIVWSYTRPIMLYFLAGVLARTLPLHAIEVGIARRTGVAMMLALAAGYLGARTTSTEWMSAIFTFMLIRVAAMYIDYARFWGRATQAVEFLGDASYSLYLTHSFVLGAVTIAVARLLHSPNMAVFASLVCGMAAAVIIAAMAYVYAERPMVRLVTRWLFTSDRRRTP